MLPGAIRSDSRIGFVNRIPAAASEKAVITAANVNSELFVCATGRAVIAGALGDDASLIALLGSPVDPNFQGEVGMALEGDLRSADLADIAVQHATSVNGL